MGLADIKGEKCLDVFADVMGPLMSIAADPEAMAFFKVHEVPDGMDETTYRAGLMKDYLPALIKAHKTDFVEILAAVNGQEPKEYAKELTVMSLFRDIMGLFTDPAFRAFLL